MKVPAKAKVEKFASTDKTRPVLNALYLRITEGENGLEGWLEGTDSYKLGRVSIELDEGDTEGFIPLEVLATARKLRADRIRCNGALEVVAGATVLATFDRPNIGQFPNTDNLFPTEFARIEGDRWRIGLNPKFLFELAEGMGADTVTLEFTATRPAPTADNESTDFRPSNLRPITVRPLGLKRGAGTDYSSTGLLMPVREKA